MTRPVAASEWHPASWQSLTATQQPNYPDPAALERALGEVSRLPPIVTSWEVDSLKNLFAKAQRGEAFVLQGGDCAESFDYCTSESVVAKLKILLQMSLVMLYGMKRPIVRVGRMAGQYAKPRSADIETRGEQSLPSYRGDLVNRSPFTPQDRIPDPQLIVRGYERAALTMNFVRSLIDGGFADLHHPEYWDLDWVGHSRMAEKYHAIVTSISTSLDFLETASSRAFHQTYKADIYASHEGLHLGYEQAQTRYLDRRKRWYNLTTHFPWIGMRTANIDGAHIEYFRGIANPVGVKIGPGMTREWLQDLVRVLNPNNEPGRLTLIHRFGAKTIEDGLPELIRAVRESADRRRSGAAARRAGRTRTAAPPAERARDPPGTPLPGERRRGTADECPDAPLRGCAARRRTPGLLPGAGDRGAFRSARRRFRGSLHVGGERRDAQR